MMSIPKNPTPAIAVFKIEKDVVFEVGLTPNRSDAMCHLGVAKDLAARLQITSDKDLKVVMPDVSTFKLNSEMNLESNCVYYLLFKYFSRNFSDFGVIIFFICVCFVSTQM